MTFENYFFRATGKDPYGYQIALGSRVITSKTIRVPTGLGKTAAAVIAWLYQRDAAPASTPRRLVYCLPMRVLVEQTRDEVQTWVKKLGLDSRIGVHVLMGGQTANEWDLSPEKDAVLIGTQDMLLSRALNRGYAMSRYRWPIAFGLLNSDCLWVFDEVQLMDASVATSSQLEAFRLILGVGAPCRSWWMSATLESSWLQTVDFDPSSLDEPTTLGHDDLRRKSVSKRIEAPKELRRSSLVIGSAAADCAAEIVRLHEHGTLTLAIFNTVDRASSVYEEVREQSKAETALIHSRFRPDDRQTQVKKLRDSTTYKGPGLIAVCTQVVEAGVDVSAKALFTELAPWASLVQRFGRCNRAGEYNESRDAVVVWFDLDESAENSEGLAKPYELEELRAARATLTELSDVAPATLSAADGAMPFAHSHVIRRRDLIGLFDTTPDLAGNDVDISRFIRDGEDLDVQVFWRDVDADTGPDTAEQGPRCEELCPVPFYKFREFAKQNLKPKTKQKRLRIWFWDGLNDQWKLAQPEDVYPGRTFLLPASAGGYSSDAGWDGKPKSAVEPVVGNGTVQEGLSGDPLSRMPDVWLKISEHTDHVVRELAQIIKELGLEENVSDTLILAARWHDWGKSHPVFQEAIRRSPEWAERRDIAKAPRGSWSRYQRGYFRHELASALGMLALGLDDLGIYLVAAHHGKVRLSIRSFPDEKPPEDDPSKLYARGLRDGDVLPAGTELGGGVVAPGLKLSLEPMLLGRAADGSPSWAERMIRLRDDNDLGPFRLAYLEALLRAADMRASKKEAEGRV